MNYVFRVRSNDSSSKLYLQIVSDMLSSVMSAGQDLLPRRFLSERFAPPVDLQGGDPCWATRAANLPNDAFTITTNCGRDGHTDPPANTLLWLDLTVFRMNTCAKRVGGGVSNLGCYFNSLRFWVPHPSVSRVRFFHGPTPDWRAIAPPARLRYSAAQGSG